MEWIDNVDSYICPVCGFETNNPNRFNKICPSCGFVAERDKPEARFAELIRADREGRVVILPCKVGDTVYLLFAGNPNNPVISTLKINTVSDAVNLIGKMGMKKYIGRFLSREEAEKALEG